MLNCKSRKGKEPEMKFLHISDLHLGKKINDFNMTDDQRFILAGIEDIIERERPDGILIAGDVYDRSIPSTEALEVFERFLYRLSDAKQQVFVISGNHDSAERVSFGSSLMESSGIHIAPAYHGKAPHYVLYDEHGAVNIYLMPFVKPANVRHALVSSGKMSEAEAGEIDSYAKAVAASIDAMDPDTEQRNVLVAHQFVTGAYTSASEEKTVGGLDNIDADVFDRFDYVALGHLHGPQTLGEKKNIRYCGTPLKYSFSEAEHRKTVTIAELGAKTGAETKLKIREIPLSPLRDWAEIRGTFDRVTSEAYRSDADTDAYCRITLLDEDDVPDAAARLKAFYPNLMNIRYDNIRTRTSQELTDSAELRERSEIELFEELFEKQNNTAMNRMQKELVMELIKKIKQSGK